MLICIPGSGHRSSFFKFLVPNCVIAVYMHFVNKSLFFSVPTTTEKKSEKNNKTKIWKKSFCRHKLRCVASLQIGC